MQLFSREYCAFSLLLFVPTNAYSCCCFVCCCRWPWSGYIWALIVWFYTFCWSLWRRLFLITLALNFSKCCIFLLVESLLFICAYCSFLLFSIGTINAHICKLSKVFPLQAWCGPEGGQRYDCGIRRGWMVSSTPQTHFTPGKDLVPILQGAGWAPGLVWMGGKSRPHQDSNPDRPACSQSLYRLSYLAHTYLQLLVQIINNKGFGNLFSCTDMIITWIIWLL